MKKLNVAIIGYKFMGKAHSNAWRKAPYFFDLNVEPVLKVACGRHEASLKEFADRWGWQETETDWQKVVARDDIDIKKIRGLLPGIAVRFAHKLIPYHTDV